MASCLHLYHLFLLTSSLVVALLLRVEAAGSNPPALGHPKQSRKCYPEDFAALQAFAATFNSILTPFFEIHWKPHLDCCSWESVACASSSAPYHISTAQNHSRVTGLSLRNKGLKGPLHPSLCRLSALSSLDLSGNNLFGPIPACIGHNLTALNRLILADNSFNFSIPQSFSSLNNLLVLDLDSNRLSGSIAPIANLSQLTYLDLNDNLFNGTMPVWNTPRLRYLDLSQLSFSSGFPRFNTTPQLQHLDLSFNQYWKGNILSLPHLRHLEELHLDATSIAAQGSSISGLFCDLISLKKLSIAGAFPGRYNLHEYSELDSEHGVNVVGRLEYELPCEKPSVNLTYLDLSGNKLTGPFPPWIGLFRKLQYLDLSANYFSGLIPQAWQSLTNLTFLQLFSDSPSPDPTYNETQLLGWLFRLPLQTLTLRSIGLTSTPQCESGLSLLNQTLEVLDLSENHLSDGLSLLQCLAHHNFTRLSELYLSNNPLAFNLSHSHPLSELSLGILDLSYCLLFGTLTMELLSSIGRLTSYGWLSLDHNDLSGNIPILDPSRANNLTSLDLSFNKLTGPFPTWLAKLPRCYSIVLNNNQLDGEISTQGLGSSFDGTEVLLLGNNHFGKAIFHNTSAYVMLSILDLSYNKLEGDLHELLGDYSVIASLIVLILSHNQLTGSIPASLGTSAFELLVLELSFNNLTGVIPNSLKMLQSPLVDTLIIRDERIADFDLQSVKGVKFRGSRIIGYLDLSSNLLNGPIPPALDELLFLNELNLSRNHLSGHIPPSLGNLTRLESLDLSYNNLQGSIPTTLSQISGLEVFNVSFNPELSGQIPGGPQFEMEDSYKGDSKVCGPQILRDCDDAYSEPPTTQSYDVHSNEQNGFWNWIERWVTIPGVCIGYGLGFGVTIWILHFYRR